MGWNGIDRLSKIRKYKIDFDFVIKREDTVESILKQKQLKFTKKYYKTVKGKKDQRANKF